MPNYNFINLSGKVFSRLTVLERVENNKFGRTRWKCKCSCGNVTIVIGANLQNNTTKSCGCLRKEKCIETKTTHGMYGTPEYRSWFHIIDRCQNPNDKDFKDYGGRGINICQEWRDSFLAFYNHVGKRPSKKHSINRINNDGNYEPGNVKWSLPDEQANNRRSNAKITINGRTMNISEWADYININHRTLRSRILFGWPPEKAVFQPVRQGQKR